MDTLDVAGAAERPRNKVKRFVFLPFIAVGWLLLLVPLFWPSSWWFKIHQVYVHDSYVGVSPNMVVSREIVRGFHGKWLVTVMKEGPDGLYVFCTSQGENDYRSDAVLPKPLNLDWWTWPLECDLPEGRYRLQTLWVIDAPFFEKKIRITSNMFTVYAKK